MTSEDHHRFLRSRPSKAGLRALVEHLEPGGAIAGVRRLKGGLDASTHRVDIITRSGVRRPLVVRRFNDTFSWFDVERLPREAETLASLVSTSVVAPEMLELDVDGRWLGTPCMVQTCLPGGPAPPHRWADWSAQLVEAMALVHQIAPAVDAEPWLTGWRGDEPPSALTGNPWLDRVWPVILAGRSALEASGGDALVHHDLHPGNSLWSRSKLSGIVDWTLAGRGFPAYDRAYLRFDLSLALGLGAGDEVEMASTALGIPPDDPTWDLVVGTRVVGSVADWTGVYVEIGLSITAADVESRLAAWFNRALASLH